MAPVKVLIVGGSYGGITALKTLLKLTSIITPDDLSGSTNSGPRDIEDGPPGPEPGPVRDVQFDITLVDPRLGFINIMSIPKMIVDPQFAATSYTPVADLGVAWDTVSLFGEPSVFSVDKPYHVGPGAKKLKRNPNVKTHFIQGYVTNLGEHSAVYIRAKPVKNMVPPEFNRDSPDNADALVTPQEHLVKYDYCILATGTTRNWPFDPIASTREELLSEMSLASDLVASSKDISIVGGGALGIEVAGEIKQYHPEKKITIIHPHQNVPPEPYVPESYKDIMVSAIKNLGINLRLNTRIQSVAIQTESSGVYSKDLLTTTNETIPSDLNMWCNYHKTNIQYLSNKTFKNTLVEIKGEVFVNSHLQAQYLDKSKTFENVFAIGDLPNLGIIKKAVGAIRSGSIAAYNILYLVNNKYNNTNFQLVSFPFNRWPKDKLAIVIGSKHSVIHVDGRVAVDHPKVMKLYADYKNAKLARRAGFYSTLN